MNIRYAIYAAILGMFLLAGAYGKGRLDEYEKYQAAAKSVRAQDVQIANAMQPKLNRTIIQAGEVTSAILPRIPYATSHFKATTTAPVTVRPGYFLTGADIVCWNAGLQGSSAASCPTAAVQAPGSATTTGHH